MSRQMRAARSRMEESENEQLRVFMDSLRGSNLNDADFADASVKMQLVEVQAGPEGDALPLEYDPDRIAEYWGRRPVAVTTRITQLMGEWGGGVCSWEWLVCVGRLGGEGGRGSGGAPVLLAHWPLFLRCGSRLLNKCLQGQTEAGCLSSEVGPTAVRCRHCGRVSGEADPGLPQGRPGEDTGAVFSDTCACGTAQVQHREHRERGSRARHPRHTKSSCCDFPDSPGWRRVCDGGVRLCTPVTTRRWRARWSCGTS